MVGLMAARGLRQAQAERAACANRMRHPLGPSLSKHVLSFAEGAARNGHPAS